MALHAIHAILKDGVVLRQTKLSVNLNMAFETRLRVLARVENEAATSPTTRDMFTAGPMARFTTRVSKFTRGNVNSTMNTCGKDVGDVGVTFSADFVSNEGSTFNLWGNNHGACDGRTRAQQ
jgi:hypothetical protein